MTAPKAGYKGKVEIDDVPIATATWTHSGGERQMQATDELGDEVITDVPLQIRGGTVTLTGNYKLASDAGQKLAATYFASGAPITNLKLYTDKISTPKIYLTPASGSYATITNCRNVGDDKSGIGTISITMLISGVLEQKGDESVVEAETTGVHGIAGGAAELVGNLNSYGGEAGAISCYFKYGTTTEMVDGPSSPADSFTEKTGLFGATLSGLAAGTVYYQAVASYDTDPVLYAYGAVKSFTAVGA